MVEIDSDEEAIFISSKSSRTDKYVSSDLFNTSNNTRGDKDIPYEESY